MMEKAKEDGNFLRNICFTDECGFTLQNAPNKRKFRVYFRASDYCTICYRRFNLTGDKSLELLEDQITPGLNDAVDEAEEIWCQMDGCPAHNARVRQYLIKALITKLSVMDM
ncbi:hypothetical protein FQA39_LY10585 [Lamprigera yunnana]|nr:hypothetical protein FQA39_LY10585 [Lamprigera yunnana]